MSIPTDSLDEFVALAGHQCWSDRVDAIKTQGTTGPRSRSITQQRHAPELMIERLRGRPNRPPSVAEQRVADLATALVREADALPARGRTRLRRMLGACLTGDRSLVPALHLMRTALLQRARDFQVELSGLADEAPFDLLLSRAGTEAEIVCDVISAEEGRGVHRSAWFRLADRIDPDLQTWLAAHPGRYLLKMTLPQGLRENDDDPGALAALHERIRTMLQARRRAEHDEAAVLRLDPLLLAAAQADELRLLSALRREFGPEAHLSVTTAGGGLFVMAARAGRENDVAAALSRRMTAAAPARLTGSRPGIMAMFIDDTDRQEWRDLRERLELEGEARQFLTYPEAKGVVAVTCASRLEMFGMTAPDAVEDGELRFRNPSHPAAKMAALAPAVLSSV